MEKEIKKSISLRCKISIDEDLEKIAKRKDRTKAWLVRKAIERYIEDENNKDRNKV